jgi:hypothetical protein
MPLHEFSGVFKILTKIIFHYSIISSCLTPLTALRGHPPIAVKLCWQKNKFFPAKGEGIAQDPLNTPLHELTIVTILLS